MDSADDTPWWFGLVCITAGLFVLLLAADVVPVDPESFKAPRIVVGGGGAIFVLGGFMTYRPGRSIGGVAACAVWLLFGLMFGWAALFGKSAEVTTTSAATTTNTDAWVGNVLFGGVSIFCFVCSLWTAVHVFRGGDVLARVPQQKRADQTVL